MSQNEPQSSSGGHGGGGGGGGAGDGGYGSSSSAFMPTLDAIFAQITTTDPGNIVQLAHALRSLPARESRDTVLAGLLPGGQDPLAALDVQMNTLGVLYILSARLLVSDAVLPPPRFIVDFCRAFDPHQARLAPDRVTALARGIMKYAHRMNDHMWALEPLYLLLTRYPPDVSYLTTIHPLFVIACVSTRQFAQALPILEVPITNIDMTLSDLTYLDNLRYHYAGGVAFGALKQWAQAEEFLEICVSSPAMVPSAVQLEALKKLKLTQLISKGKTSGLPRYSHPALMRHLKNSPYQSFINAYPHDVNLLQRMVDDHQQLFMNEKNLGLILQAIRRTPRWTLKKLTETYLKLSLAEIAKAVKINSLDEVRDLLVSMIDAGDISAQVAEDGTVTFFDTPPQFSKDQVDQLLRDVQQQSDYLKHLEREMGKSKEYLRKAIKHKDDSWASPMDDDLFSGMGPPGGPGGPGGSGWADDSMYS
ncbi:hypothetical protein AMATHDRAFT_67796 [Amanita thiersii Skay4041]|uniref:COP9 signalosome complex subunit 3 n=1 Tax=Amanita thiersii Skay4041 TaxID=703135 RepID=A0A2A9NDP3_9AGAR|nr:hypothetical protein AMATHDRAFT_67796 [Amanita thiersii Skay4041]